MMRTPVGDDRRVGDDASFYPVPWRLTILISPPTPAPYRYTGLGLVRLIIRSSSCIRPHKQKAPAFARASELPILTTRKIGRMGI